MRTYQWLLKGIVPDNRFDSLFAQSISDEAVAQIARLAIAGWTFCGADQDGIELERDGEIATIDRFSGHVHVQGGEQ